MLAAYLKNKKHLKHLTLSLLVAGSKKPIVEYLASLHKIDQQVSDLLNTQIRANQKEANANGLTDYKAYFLTGLKLNLPMPI